MSTTRDPYLGPETGDVLDARELAELERLAEQQVTVVKEYR